MSASTGALAGAGSDNVRKGGVSRPAAGPPSSCPALFMASLGRTEKASGGAAAVPSPSPASLPSDAWKAQHADVKARLEDAASVLFERNKRAKLNLSTEAKDAEIAELLGDARNGIAALESLLSAAEERGNSWVERHWTSHSSEFN